MLKKHGAGRKAADLAWEHRMSDDLHVESKYGGIEVIG
jgi:hypothetical protein